MVPRVRLVAGITAFALAFALPASAQRLESAVKVTEGSVHYQNIETAIKFLREHGEGAAADQIQEDLEDGDIYVDPAVKVNGETSMYNNISLSPGVAGNDMPVNRNIPLDPVKDFKQVMELARTLYHENYHAHEQNLLEFTTENWREYGAWMATIFEMGKWIDEERSQFDRNMNPRQPMSRQQQIDELNKLKIKAQVVMDYQGSFAENDYFGGDDTQWIAQNNTYWQHQIGLIDQKTGTLVGGGTPAGGNTPNTPPPTSPPPPPAPPKPPTPEPPDTPVTVPCLPCQKIADQIRDVKNRLKTLNENAKKADEAVTKNQQRIADLQKRVGNLQAELERAAGTGGSSYDPSTGQTIDAYDQGNGTVKVTTKDAAGNVIEEHVRDSSARKADINRQINDANTEIAKAQAESGRLAAAAATAKKLVSDMATLLNQLVAELEDCIKKNCSQIPTAVALNILGLPYRDLKTLGDPNAFNPPYTGGTNGVFQLMIIEIRVGNADGISVPGKAAASAPSKGARNDDRSAPSLLASLLSWWRPKPAYLSTTDRSRPWLPNTEVQRRAALSSPVQMVLTSLGQSTGEAFDLQIFNPGGKPFRLSPEALIVEPLKDEAKKQAQAAVQRLMSSASPVTARLNGYCLEMLKAPPSAGTIFKLAAPELQQRFAPMRKIMDASRRVQQLGQLRPDSNPEGYFNAIRQWAMWTVQEKLNEKTFTNAFVEHTKKLVTGQKQAWTKDAEETIKKASPNRWNDIQKVLAAAGVPLPR